MCGIVGLMSREPVNQRMYDALLLLQHRGQDAAGIGTLDDMGVFHTHKGIGLVKEVFRTRNMRDLTGQYGIGHVRFPTHDTAGLLEHCQPFYVSAPYGIMFAQNGRLTNAVQARRELAELDRRHINTSSDAEVLLNVLADELVKAGDKAGGFSPEVAFDAVAGVHKRVRGAYSVVALIAGKGLLAFRDPNGIRPLCFGTQPQIDGTCDYLVSSESGTMVGLGFDFERDVAPGEAVFIDLKRQFYSRQCALNPALHPCAFEYVYFARPDSVIDGISVYGARLRLGEYLAAEVASKIDLCDIDCVMPIPDSSRPTTQQLAQKLHLVYREGFVKNRYLGRTFILPGQPVRKRSVRQKLNTLPVEFKNKNVLLVDDSIIRGETIREIVSMAREAGARKVYVASAAPQVRFPNVYGIDILSRDELICGHNESEVAVAKRIGADAVIFQTVQGLAGALCDMNPSIVEFDCSCFDGRYVTGDISEAFLRNHAEKNRLHGDRIEVSGLDQ